MSDRQGHELNTQSKRTEQFSCNVRFAADQGRRCGMESPSGVPGASAHIGGLLILLLSLLVAAFMFPVLVAKEILIGGAK